MFDKKLVVIFVLLALVGSSLSAIPTSANALLRGGNEWASPTPASATWGIPFETAVLTIPAAAFTPYEDGYDFQNSGRYLQHFHSPNGGYGRGWYLAPVYLPDGAIVTKMTFYYRDNTTANGVARLQRTDLKGNYTNLASVDTSGGWSAPWYNSKATTDISNGVIDNSKYAYWVIWDLPPSSEPPSEQDIVWGCGTTIQYMPPATTPERLAIPAAAFRPHEDGYDFQNDGRYLHHFHSQGGGDHDGWYLAQVHLPDGARVTKMTFYYADANDTSDGIAKLQRSDLEGNYRDMALVGSSGTGGIWSKSATTLINSATIDNSKYAYWIVLALPQNMAAGGVIIDYDAHAISGGLLSISSAAFTPFEDGYDYENDGRYLFTNHGASGAYGWYLAPVHLPQGAKVSKMTFYWYNNRGEFGLEAKAHLQRTKLGQGNYEDMAYAAGKLPAGYGATIDDSIDHATIDNTQYAYWVVWDLPAVGRDIKGCGVIIDYHHPVVYLPLALR